LRCGEQFRRRYVEGEVIPPGIAQIRGTGLHHASQVNFSVKLRTGQDEPLSVLLDAAEDKFRRIAADGVYLTKEEKPEKAKLLENGLHQTLTLTTHYRQEVAPRIFPKFVETKFAVARPEIKLPLTGIIDVEDQHGKIVDLKTSSMKWPEERIRQEIQPVFYSLVREQETGARPDIEYQILIPYKAGAQAQKQCYRAQDNDYAALLSKMKLFEVAVKVGLFLPAFPGSWWCSDKWCGYHSTCRYVGN
jgi:hypothetical protein